MNLSPIHGVVRLFLQTVLMFDNCIYSLFCCNLMLWDRQWMPLWKCL